MDSSLQTDSEILKDVHWLMDILQSIDAGLIVLDKDYRIQLWNGFMANHSAIGAREAMGETLFSLFPELPQQWFESKAKSVFLLHNSAFTTWEQRPYLFRFKNYRPITGTAEYMYQNCTLMPIIGSAGEVDQICLIVYDVTEIAVNKKGMETANQQLERLSRTDSLTQLYNRGYWEECLEQEFKRHKRYQSGACLVMFDIDHFKKVNDTYGHPTGDEVIRETARVVRESIRDIDTAGRYGGEEFTVILPDTDQAGASLFAERLRAAIEGLLIEYENNSLQFTVSLGIAELSEQIDNRGEWISAADEALYHAKSAGRNCWRCAD